MAQIIIKNNESRVNTPSIRATQGGKTIHIPAGEKHLLDAADGDIELRTITPEGIVSEIDEISIGLFYKGDDQKRPVTVQTTKSHIVRCGEDYNFALHRNHPITISQVA